MNRKTAIYCRSAPRPKHPRSVFVYGPCFLGNMSSDSCCQGVLSNFYTLDETCDKLHLSHDIPKDYNVNTPEYMSELKDMLDMGKNMRRVFADEGQEIRYTFAMIVTSHGKMRSEFGYTDRLKSDYPNYELMDY